MKSLDCLLVVLIVHPLEFGSMSSGLEEGEMGNYFDLEGRTDRMCRVLSLDHAIEIVQWVKSK